MGGVRTTADAVADLFTAFPRPEATVDHADLYVDALSDLPQDTLDRAVRLLIRTYTSHWRPVVAQVREAAAELELELPSDQQALAQVDARIRWAQAHADATVDDAPTPAVPDVHPLVREALDSVGGWHAVRTAERPSVVRGQLVNLYRDARARAIAGYAAELRRPALERGGGCQQAA